MTSRGMVNAKKCLFFNHKSRHRWNAERQVVFKFTLSTARNSLKKSRILAEKSGNICRVQWPSTCDQSDGRTVFSKYATLSALRGIENMFIFEHFLLSSPQLLR
jgi:hypothetical protein